MSDYIDQSPEYWNSYSNLQHVKHALIREYLNGWFPILGSWAGRVLYIDTHAGRGRHATGALGSPLVALSALIHHKHRDRLLSRCEVHFVFIERDASNLQALKSELASYEPLPKEIRVHPVAADYQAAMERSLRELRQAGQRLAPAFVFVDPYGFSLSYGLLRDFMSFSAIELFVNVMWRYLDMAIAQSRTHQGKADLLDTMFCGSRWRQDIDAGDADGRAEQTLRAINDIVGAKWATPVWMLGLNKATEYILLHLTNHDAGRDLMKQVMWRVCASAGGEFVARRSDDPSQQVLLVVEPDLQPLAEWVTARLREGPVRWRVLDEGIRREVWLRKHLNSVIRRLHKEGVVEATNYSGRFACSSDPLLSLAAGGPPPTPGERRTRQ